MENAAKVIQNYSCNNEWMGIIREENVQLFTFSFPQVAGHDTQGKGITKEMEKERKEMPLLPQASYFCCIGSVWKTLGFFLFSQYHHSTDMLYVIEFPC